VWRKIAAEPGVELVELVDLVEDSLRCKLEVVEVEHNIVEVAVDTALAVDTAAEGAWSSLVVDHRPLWSE